MLGAVNVKTWARMRTLFTLPLIKIKLQSDIFNYRYYHFPIAIFQTQINLQTMHERGAFCNRQNILLQFWAINVAEMEQNN